MLQIRPNDPRAEVTWVRPDLDFTALPTSSSRSHRLSPVQDEAQWLIDAPNEPTRVVRLMRAG